MQKNNGIFRGERDTYKPFAYPFAFEFYEIQNKLHWLPSEVSLAPDVKQWKTSLTPSEKHLLTQVQLFLAQADSDIADVYVNKYLPNLRLPELRMALLSIANMEAIHMNSYSYTIDTLGMPESSYSAFLEIDEMRKKHEFITKHHENLNNPVRNFMLTIAVDSGFGEGMQLFSAFALIMSFYRRGLMTGLGTLTSFIARDEDLHTEFMIKVFNTMKEENPGAFNDQLIRAIALAGHHAVVLEDHFIDLAFQLGAIENITNSEVKQYIRYIANKRLQSMGCPLLYPEVKTNPLPWMDEILAAPEHANFFETRSTSYSKSNYTGSWEDVWSKM